MAAVLVPVFAVFLTALGVVPVGAMNEKNGKPDGVGVRHHVEEESREGPEECQRQLWHVVEMTRESPVAGHQEKTGTCLTTGQCILGSDHFCWPTPHQTFPIGLAHDHFLTVGSVVDHAADDACRKDKYRPQEAKLDRPGCEIHAHGGVDAGDPAEAAPADVEPGPIEHDVDGPHVARLPPEELGKVDHLQYCRHPDAVHKTVQLIILQNAIYQPMITCKNVK